jgi:hypothetical protein
MGWRPWLSIGLWVAAAALAGCATLEPMPAGLDIRLVQEPSFVAQCRWVAAVRGGQATPLLGAVAHTRANARTRIRTAAAHHGANVVVVTRQTETVYGTWMDGDAYACPRP